MSREPSDNGGVNGQYEVAGRVRPRSRTDATLDVMPPRGGGQSLGQVLALLRDQDVTISVRYAQRTRCSYCGVTLPMQGGREHKERARRVVCDAPACVRAAERDRKREWRRTRRGEVTIRA